MDYTLNMNSNNPVFFAAYLNPMFRSLLSYINEISDYIYIDDNKAVIKLPFAFITAFDATDPFKINDMSEFKNLIFGSNLSNSFSDMNKDDKKNILVLNNILKAINFAAKIADELKKDFDPKKRLIDNLNEESDAEVIKNIIGILSDKFSNDNDVKITIKKFTDHADADIALSAGIYLQKEGLPSLISLLNRDLNSNQLLKIIGIIKKYDVKEIGHTLTVKYEKTDNDDVKISIIDVLYLFNKTKYNYFFISKLADESIEVKLKIIGQLKENGDLSAIEQLYRLNRKSFNPKLKNKINQAIAAIQLKYGEGESGMLSVPEINIMDGALSNIVFQNEGKLSLKD